MFSRTVMSLDIGSSHTKVVIGKEKGGEVLVEDAFMFDTPGDSVFEGHITDK